MIAFLLACATVIETHDASPNSFDFEPESTDADIVLDSFIEPYGLGLMDDTMLITDAGSGELWQWTPDEPEAILIEDDLGSPTHLASAGTNVVIYDSDGLRLLLFDGTEWSLLEDGIEDIGTMIIHENDCFVTVPDSGELIQIQLEAGMSNVLLDGLQTPYGLSTDGTHLWIGTQGDQTIWTHEISTGDTQEVFVLPEVPYGLEMTDELWIATRSTRWPYGGWIYRYQDSLSQVSASPPEANLILETDNGVIWSSKQSITYLEHTATAYQTIGVQTAVGSMQIHNDMLYWTDRQSGRLYRSTF